jgi:hypothetical protein
MIKKVIDLTLLLRVENDYNKMKNKHDNNKIEFSCPANWIDYFLKNNDSVIGDINEGVFAHDNDNLINLNKLKDSHGEKMGNNLLVFRNNNSCSLRYMPIILTPTICFYSISIGKMLEENIDYKTIEMDLRGYCKELKYNIDTAGVILIDKPSGFINELKEELKNVMMINSNLSDERFYTKFNPIDPIDAGIINYYKYNKNKNFFDNAIVGQELFWKDEDYSWQNEFRIIIKNAHFKQYFNPNLKNYDYSNNILTIKLKNLNKYCKLFKLSDVDKLIMSINDDLQTIKYGFSKCNECRKCSQV